MAKLPILIGLTLDVPALLQELSPNDLVSAVKGAIAVRSQQASAVYCRSGVKHINVTDLLRGLERRELLVAVRAAVEHQPAVKHELVRELQHLIGSESANASRLPQIQTGISNCPSVSSTSLGSSRSSSSFLTGSSRKPPKMPGKGQTPAISANLRRRHSSLSKLPRLPEHSPTEHQAEELEDPLLLGQRLRQAIRDKDGSQVQSLILARADLNSSDGDGATASALAVVQGTPPFMLRSVLEAKGDVHVRDGQGRSLVHIWSWSLQKSRTGLQEAQTKITILVNAGADLNARLPASGDTPLHVLATVFNRMSCRADDAAVCESHSEILGGQKNAEKFVRGVSFRIQMLVNARADVSVRDSKGKVPLEVIEKRYQSALPEFGGYATTHLCRQDVNAASSVGELLCDPSSGGCGSVGIDKAMTIRLDQAQDLS